MSSYYSLAGSSGGNSLKDKSPGSLSSILICWLLPRPVPRPPSIFRIIIIVFATVNRIDKKQGADSVVMESGRSAVYAAQAGWVEVLGRRGIITR